MPAGMRDYACARVSLPSQLPNVPPCPAPLSGDSGDVPVGLAATQTVFAAKQSDTCLLSVTRASVGLSRFLILSGPVEDTPSFGNLQKWSQLSAGPAVGGSCPELAFGPF